MNPTPPDHTRRTLLALLAATQTGFGRSARAADATGLWFQAGRPTADAAHAIRLLNDAAGHGLEPADYAAADLARAWHALLSAAQVDPARQAAFDLELTRAIQRYLTDLHRGRVDPRQIHERFSGSRPAPPAWLDDLAAAIRAQGLAKAAAAAVPTVPGYAALLPILARYRNMTGHPAWSTSLPAPTRPAARAVRPGEDYAGLDLLAERLMALGDLPAGPLPTRYEGTLVDAVRAFQRRHGLAIDGVLGAATFEQLAVTPGQRAHQVALTLERLRWTPLLQGPRMIVVNIPEFVLRAYEVRDGRIEIGLTMRVIVGRALDTRTPVFDEIMRAIEFSPYWNIPPSIARGETVPRLRRDPAYFVRQGLEFVLRDGTVSTELSSERLDAVLRGQARIRQRPGPLNALGDIKFIFPNNDNIFLHHTPTPKRFEQARRDFSHGCIRVEDPVALAAFVLRNQPGWSESRIREAMALGRSNSLRLAETIPVLIGYGTAIPQADGSVHFHPDLYRHDALLDQALQAAGLIG